MKKTKQITGIAIWGVVVAIVIAIAVYFLYINKPHPNYDKLSPDFKLTASALYTEFTTAKPTAETKYNGKVVEITGIPTTVEKTDTTRIIVFAFNSGMFGDEGIRCNLLEKYFAQADKFKTGATLTVKGYCSGYNDTDVVLEHVSIIKK